MSYLPPHRGYAHGEIHNFGRHVWYDSVCKIWKWFVPPISDDTDLRLRREMG